MFERIYFAFNTKRFDWYLLTTGVLFALSLIGGIWIRLHYLQTDRMWPDEALYSWYAKRLLDNPALVFSKEIIEYHPPLFSVILAIAQSFSPGELASRSVSMFFNVAGIILITVLGKKVGGSFVGIFCGINLSFNYIYNLMSNAILIDSALASAFLLFLIKFIDLIEAKDNKTRHAVVLGLMGSMCVLLKWISVLILPVMLIFGLFVYMRTRHQEQIKYLAIPFALTAFCTGLLLYNNHLELHSWNPNISVIQSAAFSHPWWFYLERFIDIYFLLFLIPFLFYGFYVIWRGQSQSHWLMGIWFSVFFVAICLAKQKDPRFYLTVLPVSFVIIGIGVNHWIDDILKPRQLVRLVKVACLVLVFLSYVILMPLFCMLFNKWSNEEVGYREAGQWVQKTASPGTLVMAGAPRAIRYFSGIDFKEFKGSLIHTPEDRDEFEKLIRETEQPILLEVGYWENIQPSWVFPFTEKKHEYLKSLGFVLDKVVSKPVFRGGELVNTPVICLFQRKSNGQHFQ